MFSSSVAYSSIPSDSRIGSARVRFIIIDIQKYKCYILPQKNLQSLVYFMPPFALLDLTVEIYCDIQHRNGSDLMYEWTETSYATNCHYFMFVWVHCIYYLCVANNPQISGMRFVLILDVVSVIVFYVWRQVPGELCSESFELTVSAKNRWPSDDPQVILSR